MDEEWIKHALEAAIGNKKPDWDHASHGTSLLPHHIISTDDGYSLYY